MKWADTTKGKKIPLDPDPVPNGNILLVNGIAAVVGQSDDPADIRHISHFATCESPFNPANRKKQP
jgi:hypothetical protein